MPRRRLLLMAVDAIGLLRRLRAGPQTVLGRRALGVAAAVLFVALTVIAYRSLPDDRGPIRPWPIVGLVVVGGPAMLAITTLEYRALARQCGVRTGWVDALAITVASTGANLLPVPGSVLVRSAHLHRNGASARSIAAGMTAFGLGFVGVASAGAGVAFLLTGNLVASLVALAASVAVVAAIALLVARSAEEEVVAAIGRILAVEVGVVVVVVSRLAVVLYAMSIERWVLGALSLGAASALSTAVAIFPGGLGLREGLSGLVGTVVGLDVATGVIAAGIDRVTFLVVLALATLWLTFRKRHGDVPDVLAQTDEAS